MKIAQLKSLVKHGESETLEFKHSTGSITAGMQTICAFLNSDHGGTVIFGVSDKGHIVGQAVTDKTKKEIGIELNKLEPHTRIEINYVPASADRKAIVFTVDPGEKLPYTYDGRAYIRHQSTTKRMTQEEFAYLYNKKNPTTWEGLPNTACKITDLDRNRIHAIIRIAVSEKRLPESAMKETIPDILKKLGLMVHETLTNAAVILFCKKEDKQFFQSYIMAARFQGNDKTKFLDNKMFKGNAFDLYEKAMDFLHFALPVAAHIEPGNPDRIETPAIPYTVLREALTNTLIHRDYGHVGGAIAIAIYDDRVNITNIGSLPRGVSVGQLSKQHASVQRNPLIAHVFYLCKKIEKWGRGTLDMIEDCKKVGNPLPHYEEVGGTFSVTLPLKEPIRTIITKQPVKLPQIKLTDRQKEIITVLRNGPLKTQEIRNAIHTNLADRMMQLELAKLRRMGLIKSEGRTKTTLWFLIKQD